MAGMSYPTIEYIFFLQLEGYWSESFAILHRKLRTTYSSVVKWGTQAKGESERAKV